jgi:hypothetical protein
LPKRAAAFEARNQVLAKQLATPQFSRITGTVFGSPTTERRQRSRPARRSAVPESDYIRKHAVMCLRLAAECRDLAAGVATPELRARVLRMADMWEDLADQPPSESTPDDSGSC